MQYKNSKNNNKTTKATCIAYFYLEGKIMLKKIKNIIRNFVEKVFWTILVLITYAFMKLST